MKHSLTLLIGALALGVFVNGLHAQFPNGQLCVLPPATPEGPPSCDGAVPADAVECCPASSGHSGLVGGGAFYLLKPFLQNNTAYITTTMGGTPMSQVTENSFNYGMAPAAAFWIGYASPDGLGVQSRFFHLDESSALLSIDNGSPAAGTPITTVNPPLSNFLPLSTGGAAFGTPGTVLAGGIGHDHLTFSSDLKITSVDLAATYAWQGRGWSVLASAGGRYMYMSQDYRASLANTGDGSPVSESQMFTYSRTFNGGGPLLGLQGNAEIGRTGLSVFACGRTALLVGASSETNAFSLYVNDPTGLLPPGIPGVLQLNPRGSRAAEQVIPVTELEIGLEYDIQMQNSQLVFRSAAVNQTYFDAGNSSQPNGNLSLLGVQFSVAWNY